MYAENENTMPELYSPAIRKAPIMNGVSGYRSAKDEGNVYEAAEIVPAVMTTDIL